MLDHGLGEQVDGSVAGKVAHLEYEIKLSVHCTCMTKGQFNRNACCLRFVTGKGYNRTTAVK